MKIFADLDGFLVNFISDAMKVWGATFSEMTYPNTWNIWEVLKLESEAHFWERIDKQGQAFWENLEPYPWFEEAVEILNGAGDLRIITKPHSHPSCHAGKKAWCDKYLPKVRVIMCDEKWLVAGPGRILVDDNDGNVQAWRENGGEAILWPMAWNLNRHLRHQRLDHLEDELFSMANA